MEFYGATPEKKDYRQDPKAIAEWLEVTYPAIVKRAAEENAEIWWLDETGARNNSNYIKGYAPKGKTPTLPVASVHIGVNMISAITNKGKLRYHFYHGNFNQQIYIGFLTRLIKVTDKKVYAIVDNCSTHRGLLAADWKEKNAALITIFNLPSYAPELNPTEYLNNNLKRVLLYKGYSKSKNEVEAKAMSIMRSIQSTKNRVESFFDNEFVKYAKSQE
jgi:transposase